MKTKTKLPRRPVAATVAATATLPRIILTTPSPQPRIVLNIDPRLQKIRDIDTRDFSNYYSVFEATWSEIWKKVYGQFSSLENISSQPNFRFVLNELSLLRATLDRAADHLLSKKIHPDKLREFFDEIEKKFENLLLVLDSAILALEKNKKLEKEREMASTLLIAQKVSLEEKLKTLRKQEPKNDFIGQTA